MVEIVIVMAFAACFFVQAVRGLSRKQ